MKKLLLLLLLALSVAVQAQDYLYATNNDTILITQYIGLGGAVTIPDKIDGLPVTRIGIFAFAGNTNLASVTISNSVTSIGDSAFHSCTSLTNVTIGNNVTNIEQYAFYQCTSLGSATIPNSVTSIKDSTFAHDSSLISITIPNSVTSIRIFAFTFCTSLTMVTIPNGITNIESNAFQFCGSLNGVYFNGNAPSADSSVFSGDNNARVYYLPGTTGWGTTFAGRPTVLWNPQAQTADGSFGVRTNRFGFNITGSSILVIVVEACTNLTSSSWTPVSTNTLNTFIGTNGTSYFSDPQWTNYPARFYRLRSP